MEPAHVIWDMECVVGFQGSSQKVLCRWIWNPREPAQVILRLFNDDHHTHEDWIFGRDILVDSFAEPSKIHGEGAVQTYPALYTDRFTMILKGDTIIPATVWFDYQQLEGFTRSTVAQVPLGEEVYDVDSWLAELDL